MWDPLTLPLHDQLGKMETEHDWLGVLRWLFGISVYGRYLAECVW